VSGPSAAYPHTFCCANAPSQGCYRDPSVSCAAPYLGYNCQVYETFNNLGSTFACSSGNAPFCCAGHGGAGGCVAADAGTCAGNGTPYTCFGTDTPEPTTPSVACDSGRIADPNAQSTGFCCFPFTSSACTPSHSVVGCLQAGLYGFNCTGTATPDQTDSTLKCDVGANDAKGGTDYCCLRQ
jgi:hypothetical protein